MAKVNEYELVVSEGKRSIFERIAAAVFFTGMILVMCGIIFELFSNDITETLLLQMVKELEPLFFCFAGGVAFSATKTVLIDLDRDELISRFNVGPFSRDRISIVPQLEYVAVFLNAKDYFEVNLWYKGNKHYKMFRFEKKADAMQFAKIVAEKLKLDVLDATVKGDSKWIETTES